MAGAVKLAREADDINAKYRKPFEYDWKRELVHRNTDAPRIDVYYITPEGTRLRSMPEIKRYLDAKVDGSDLAQCLTLENFSLVKEPLGFDKEKEIIRAAYHPRSPKAGVKGKGKNSPEEVESWCEVDKILDMKEINGIRHFRIRWKGFGPEEDLWQEETQTRCTAAIKLFLDPPASEENEKAQEKDTTGEIANCTDAYDFSAEVPVIFPNLTNIVGTTPRAGDGVEQPSFSGMKTPDTPYGATFKDNPSPETRKRTKRWIDRQYWRKPAPEPAKKRRDSTPIDELKKRCWAKLTKVTP